MNQDAFGEHRPPKVRGALSLGLQAVLFARRGQRGCTRVHGVLDLAEGYKAPLLGAVTLVVVSRVRASDCARFPLRSEHLSSTW